MNSEDMDERYPMSDPNFEASATGGGLVAFLDYSIHKGHLKVATGQSMKTAVKEVLSATDREGWETVDLDALDVDDVLRRFETLRAMKYSPGSLATYRGRFQTSFNMFAEFRSSPATWRPNFRQRTRKSTKADTALGKSMASPAPMAENPDQSASEEPTTTLHRATIITYPFPLRDGVLASIELPADLTTREARRLAAFIDSLAVDDSPEARVRVVASEGD